MLKITRFSILAIFAGIQTHVGAAEVNLLPNGDFSAANQIAGWNAATIGHVLWVAEDADNNSGSGSIELDMDENNPTTPVTSACFTVVPGAAYSFSGQGRMLTSTFGLQVTCDAYADAVCTQAQYITTLSYLGLQALGNSWAPLATASGSLPADAHSVQCNLAAEVSPSNAFTAVRVDNIYFKSAQPATPVRLQSFKVD